MPIFQRLTGPSRDPDLTFFHRALRAAIVLPPLLWFGLHVLHDPQFALVAAFGSFAALGMADFMGPRRSRLLAHLVLAVGGAVVLVIGTLLSNTLWPAVIAMLVIGVAAQFMTAFGGQFALGNNAGALAFVVAVMVPAPDGAIGSRVAGWFTAMACSALIATLLWPRHERRDLYVRVADACRALAATARAVVDNDDVKASLANANDAVHKVRDVQRALGFRQIGPPGHQRALLGIVDALGQALRFAGALASARALTPSDRDLARGVAATLDAIADVMGVSASGQTHHRAPEIEALVKARHEHRALLDTSAAQALASHLPAAEVVAVFTAVFPVRVLSFVTLAMAIDALVITGHPFRVDDDFVVLEPTQASSALNHAAATLLPHLSPNSVFLHNSLRAGIAFALAVLVAKFADIEHAFWVVLATLSILRSNVATTGATVISALIGTLAGFALATVTILLLGPHPVLLWLTLPFAVFLSGYAPYAISFGAGQAMFALLVVELFNLMVPQGWVVGAERLEAVAVGAVVALAASLIMWPKGAAAALREEVAANVRAGRDLVQAAFSMLLGNDHTGVESVRADAFAARRRADEALATYIGERGTKRVSIDVWGWLARVPIVMRGAADAVISLRRSGHQAGDMDDATRLLEAALVSVCASFGELADRLEGLQVAADEPLRAAIADLDMAGGGGQQRAAIAAAIVAYVESHRDAPELIPRVKALAWGLGWLSYLATIRVTSDPPLAQVVSSTQAPWWR
ncbi:MAG: FUSC family protein [Burkholderiales bacterium]